MNATEAYSAAFPAASWGRLRASFLRAAEQSPFVRAQLRRSQLSAQEAVADPDNWRRLQPITKRDLLADQERDPPYGERRCAPLAEISLVVESSGSSGQGREVHYATRSDLELAARHWAGYLARMGVRPGEVVALTLPIGMAGGGVRHWYAYVEADARVLRLGGLSAERKLEAIPYYRATTLVATPAYVDRLAAASAEAGIPPAELGIRRLVVATQSLSTEWIRECEDLWGAKLYEWYGTSAGIAAFSCQHGMLDPDGARGTLHWNPEIAFYEVLDPDTGEPVADGARGELVGTPLLNTAEPIFRMRTGDEVRFRAPRSCRCGSPWPGIESGTVRRLDAMFKVKGINVWPAQVEAALLDLPDVLDYRVRIWQDESKRERIGLEVLPRAGFRADLESAVAAALRSATGIGFEVAIRDDREAWAQATVGESGKAKRWVDQRLGKEA